MAKRELFSQWAQGSLVLADQGFSTGSRFWVHSGTGTDSAGHGHNPDAPFATVDYAIGKCTASKGDIIYVMPGHAETLDGATDLVVDVAGVHIIGLGTGSLRPTFTFGSTDAIISVTAADVTIQNIVLVGNIDNIVTGISLGANADGCSLQNIEMRDGATNKEFLVGIAIAANCHDVTIKGLRFCGLAGGATSCIAAAGATNRFRLLDSYINGTFSAQVVNLTAAASTDIEIARNVIINNDTSAGLGVAAHNSSTGFVYGNCITNLKDTVVGVSGTGLAYAENYCSNALNASGILKPAADS